MEGQWRGEIAKCSSGIGINEVSSRFMLGNITMTSVMAAENTAGHLEQLSGGHSERT